MSHFSLSVIGAKNKSEVEEQLKPFWELDLAEDELIADPRSEFICKIPLTELEAEFVKHKKKYENESNPSEYKTARLWAEHWHGYSFNEEVQAYGYYRNPKAKWDWYSIGGRWFQYLKLKEGRSGTLGEPSLMCLQEDKEGYADIAKRGDVDWEEMKKINHVQALHLWEEKIKYQKSRVEEAHKGKEFREIFKPSSGEDLEKRKLEFIKANSSYATFAVLKDGKWYEKGEMGWFGTASNEKDPNIWSKEFNKLIENLDDDIYLAIVDCHI